MRLKTCLLQTYSTATCCNAQQYLCITLVMVRRCCKFQKTVSYETDEHPAIARYF